VFWGGKEGLDLTKHDVVDVATLTGGAGECDAKPRTNGFACLEAMTSSAKTADAGAEVEDDNTRELVLVSKEKWHIAKYHDGAWKLETEALACGSGGDTVGAGDVTGDGVDDIVIASERDNTTHVYRGVPVIP